MDAAQKPRFWSRWVNFTPALVGHFYIGGDNWLTIDGRVYDLTLDQFQSTLGNKFDQLRRPLFSSAKHPLRMHFFHKKKRDSTIDAYLDFCDQYTGAENGLKILQFLAKKLSQDIDKSV
ncbi:TPA: hypothetical protein ACGD2I_000571 [Aeromonas hydrophila]|uniref:hypothetical protein n=1 Tax=Aeromonas hydrophila TaxID=644 RepID=UPI0021E7E7F8|nr:hypothetical protein [Aeromonas hydrophila]MCV3294052.1 hypothetical protein [Aeromonas hydrophila]